MKEKLKMNYISLVLSGFMILFMGFMYLLIGKTMGFPIKVGYLLAVLGLFILIVYNIGAIVKKLSNESIG